MVLQLTAASFYYTRHPWLDGKHTIFGHVVDKGINVVNLIEQNDYVNKVLSEKEKQLKV
jgi:peptidylprolyl isomerase